MVLRVPTPRLVAAATALAAAVTVGVAGAHAAPVRPQPCEHVAASPAFAEDGTAFCAGTVMERWAPTGLAVFVTTDKGRSWRKTAAVGLTYVDGARVYGLVVSPRFAQDRTIVVSVWSVGTFVSLDAGETFTPLIPGAIPRVRPFEVAVGDTAGRAMFLVARWLSDKPHVVDPLTRIPQPVVGAPEPATDFLISPRWTSDQTALAFTQTGQREQTQVNVYACTVAFECTTRLTSLPRGWVYYRGWLAADFPGSKTVFVELVHERGFTPPRLYVSRDGGRTFAPLASAQALVGRHVYKGGDGAAEPPVALAVGPPGTDRVWMRVQGSSRVTSPPAAVYRSDDNGRTWVRVAYGRLAQRGTPGTIPDLRVPSRPMEPPVILAATGDKRLFLNGITKGGWDVACSADAGRTWAPSCP